MSTLVAVPIL